MVENEHVTLTYKWVATTPIHVDIYPPCKSEQLDTPVSSDSDAIPAIPAVVYFHGGGLSVGNRKSWFPSWLHTSLNQLTSQHFDASTLCALSLSVCPDRVASLGYAFISADYQLSPPATGHDIVQDIRDLFDFLVSADISIPTSELPVTHDKEAILSFKFKIDLEAIAVAGSSAGGLCAYLAAMHCVSPKPKAVLSMYGMGGNFLTPHYLTPKTEPFFRGREILDPEDPDLAAYLHPFVDSTVVVDSPLKYHPNSYKIPGYPANPRMLLARLYLQLGVFLDYYTGEHEPSLSTILRDAASGTYEGSNDVIGVSRALIPDYHHSLFPQFGVVKWPPTLLCHGTCDTAVLVSESRVLRDVLKGVGVKVEMIEFEGKEHSFDYEPDAEAVHKAAFDTIGAFLKRELSSD